MGTPSRFYNGINTERANGNPLSNMPFPDMNNIQLYTNDFFTYNAGDWTVNAGGAGSGTAVNTTSGSSITLTWATSGVQANSLTSSFITIVPASSSAVGTQVWFDTSLLMYSTVATPGYVAGLTAGALTTVTAMTDGIYFTKAAAASTWSIVLKSTAGSTSTFALPNTTTANSAQISLSFYYDGKPTPTLFVYYNQALVGTLRDGTAGDPGSLGTAGVNNLANLPASTVYLQPSFVLGTGGTLGVDYVTAATDIARN